MATLGLLWNLEVTAWSFEPPPTRLPPTKFAMNFSFTIAECSADGLYHVARDRGVDGYPPCTHIDGHYSPGEFGVDATGRTPYEDGRPARHDIRGLHIIIGRCFEDLRSYFCVDFEAPGRRFPACTLQIGFRNCRQFFVVV